MGSAPRSRATPPPSTRCAAGSPSRMRTARAPRPRWPPLSELGRALAEQLAGDDQQLDLLRALEDVEDLGVARPLLEQVALAVADAAAELDAAERDLDAGPPGLRLRHRGLQRVRLAVVGHP